MGRPADVNRGGFAPAQPERVMRALIAVLVAVAIAAAVGWAVAYRPAINAVEPKPGDQFDKDRVAAGAKLAAIGNCITCHTADDGKPFAGGRALATPFGKIYGTNITPDPETGIGRWNEEAFIRAMREGISRDGRHLYPAFPYPHFSKMDDEDLRALYSYFMSRAPVRAEAPENELPFPFNLRVLVAGWNLLYHDDRPAETDPARGAMWNRGAYLVEGLAHCGACHTPLNFAGAEKQDERMAGGQAQGWHAPALDASSPAPVPWDAEAVARYLRDGEAQLHGSAAGPMADVVRNLRNVPESDIRAIAVYVASLSGPPSAERRQRAAEIVAAARKPPEGRATGSGAVIFSGACAVCHETGRNLDIGLSTAVHSSDPHNLIRVIVEGIHPLPGARGAFMPAFSGVFTDDQIATLVRFLRERYSDQAAWTDVPEQVRRILRGEH